MFQEANATAHDIKTAIPGAKYFLLCEWLDMTPISTAPTDIDEVIILRKGKRMNSNIRKDYSTYHGRKNGRANYLAFLEASPFRAELFQHFIDHVKGILDRKEPEEDCVLELGYF
jgi:hypothetical protein